MHSGQTLVGTAYTYVVPGPISGTNWSIPFGNGTITASGADWVTIVWNSAGLGDIKAMGAWAGKPECFNSYTATLSVNAVNPPPPPPTISGRVMGDCAPAGYFNVTAGSYSTTTGPEGYSSITVPSGWSGTVSVSGNFSPSGQYISNVTSSQNVNFTFSANVSDPTVDTFIHAWLGRQYIASNLTVGATYFWVNNTTGYEHSFTANTISVQISSTFDLCIRKCTGIEICP